LSGCHEIGLELLLPHLAGVAVVAAEVAGGRVRIWARPRAEGADCPHCCQFPGRVHSGYERRLADAPVGGQPVTIWLAVRRFFCGNPGCAAVTFAEQVEGLASRRARRTPLLARMLTAVALALAGRAGSRLAAALGPAAGRSGMLRLVMALPDPETGTVTVLGVDDFAFRRGRRYGTILVNVETGQPVDLLPDREAATLAAWLGGHPGAAVICRDRAGAYADGARQGAPEAEQVADRWHVYRNLSGHVAKAVARHRGRLEEPAPAPEPGEAAGGRPAAPGPQRAAAEAAARRAEDSALAVRTRQRHELVQALKSRGKGIKPIARPTEKALRDLRRRLGAAPLRLLFESLAGPAAQPQTPGVRYRRWRTVAFDGCSSAKAPDRPRVCEWLGKIRHRYGEDGYPMLRIVALCETGTRALLGAVFGPVADCETSYAEMLLPLLDASMLLLDDRGFDADDFLAKIAATGAQMLVRLNSRRVPARWAVLPDGSYLTRINGVRLRVIDAQVTVTASGGLELGGEYRLATTLLDHRRYPAAELAALYHERWEVELVFYSLRCTLQQGLVLRSQDPVGVQQEVWAQLAVYQALRRAMTDAVESVPGTDPDRASFTVALETAREQVTAADGIVPGAGRSGCGGRVGRAVLGNLLPARRPRTAPRKVKCPISRYANPPDQLHLPVTARITSITVAIRQACAPDGRRDRTLQLMRTEPHRAWHASEIAAGLGLAQHRGLTGELSRWVKEGIFCRTAPGTFTIHPDWTVPDNPANYGVF
jgi:transposase